MLYHFWYNILFFCREFRTVSAGAQSIASTCAGGQSRLNKFPILSRLPNVM
jgi:hypothetical protein